MFTHRKIYVSYNKSHNGYDVKSLDTQIGARLGSNTSEWPAKAIASEINWESFRNILRDQTDKVDLIELAGQNFYEPVEFPEILRIT